MTFDWLDSLPAETHVRADCCGEFFPMPFGPTAKNWVWKASISTTP